MLFSRELPCMLRNKIVVCPEESDRVLVYRENYYSGCFLARQMLPGCVVPAHIVINQNALLHFTCLDKH